TRGVYANAGCKNHHLSPIFAQDVYTPRLKFYRVLKKKNPPPPHIGLYFVGNLIFICYILFYFI
ncbi:hypothetical protein, partial [Kingella kingae]|uniref:hypothetical protein n=1 Tax=Kingella kingae TaxID=504 RepID=UPI001E2870B2